MSLNILKNLSTTLELILLHRNLLNTNCPNSPFDLTRTSKVEAKL